MIEMEVWHALRVLNVCIFIVTFSVMIYKGLSKLLLENGELHWDKFMNLLWVLLAMFSTVEILTSNLAGGIRIPAQTAIALLQLFVVIRFYDRKGGESGVGSSAN